MSSIACSHLADVGKMPVAGFLLARFSESGSGDSEQGNSPDGLSQDMS